MASPSKKVLITGIDGFTGQHLEKHLEQNGFDVYGTSYKKIEKENCFPCDITDTKTVNDVIEKIVPDYVIHLAAISFVAADNIENFYKVNVLGTQNLLDALLNCNQQPEKVIIASSATVYGNQGLEVLDENLCPSPVNHYGISKLAMEQIVKTYFDKLNIVVTRPFNYTGIGQADNFLIPKIVNHYKEGKKVIELGNINVKREFNDISFLLDVYLKLMLSDSKSEIVNVCSGIGVSLLDVITTMNQMAGYEIEIRVNPQFVRKNEIPVLTGSTKKLAALIDQLPSSDIKNTLRDMFESK